MEDIITNSADLCLHQRALCATKVSKDATFSPPGDAADASPDSVFKLRQKLSPLDRRPWVD
jgi:hypothetical protein